MSINRSLSLNNSVYHSNLLSDEEGDQIFTKSTTFFSKVSKKKLEAKDLEEAIEKEIVVVNNIHSVGKTQSWI